MIFDETYIKERKNQRLRSIGVNPTRIIDEDGESENSYRVEAMVYIIRDEEVPKELLEKMKKYDAEYKKRFWKESNA